jgi:hypothetical protein
MGEGTGACGINCHTCGLFRQGKCSICGAGTEPEAQKKLATQINLLGGTCAILECAVARKVSYCSADCEAFPCRHFSQGPYPYSRGYLDMQVRRRGQPGLPPSPKDGTPGGKLH